LWLLLLLLLPLLLVGAIFLFLFCSWKYCVEGGIPAGASE